MPGGVASPEDLWRVVSQEIDTVVPLPTDRGWDVDAQGVDHPDEAPLLDDVAGFDNAFFDIDPDEARGMDPQHRLLLETCWEAVERARLDPKSLVGQRVGVFAGLSNSFYHGRFGWPDASVRGQQIYGSALGAAAARVAYHLSLRGPALSLDSACASSLVAVHLASTALRNRECDLALVGGVSVIPSLYVFDDYHHNQKRPGDGRVKPFAADADGSNLAEGVGVLLVERLSDARRHGHRVLAQVAGSAVDQDGVRNTFGSLSPSGLERLVRTALADAQWEAGDVDAVEAHVPGNLAGDVMEAEAYLNTYGRGHSRSDPVWIGSGKSNWGNPGASAGVAGIIKMVMAMRHGVMPRTLHTEDPSPHVDWTSGGVSLLRRSRAWPDRGGPRRAAISGFAAVGSNAHVILQQGDADDADGPAGDASGAAPARVVPWLLSARSDAALREQAARLAEEAKRVSR
ncbi:MAG TPA: polyketide synthase, partial [Stackebrandtia sp.]|uniref:polyketide synthase n=1 Tax=Stackebrandtia sp. TaxID=2023065 RepID=UPI002D264E8F